MGMGMGKGKGMRMQGVSLICIWSVVVYPAGWPQAGTM